MSKENELLPCPFCGGAVQFFRLGRDNTGDFYITCPKCEECEKAFESKEEAAKAWNKRVYPKDVQEAINKQVPMKPEVVKDALDQTRFFCGKCGGQVDDVASIELTGKFCCLCGQKIDWKNKDLG